MACGYTELIQSMPGSATHTPSRRPQMGHPVVQVACGVVAFVALCYNCIMLNLSVEQLHANDFGKFYYATQAWWTGGSLYAPNLATHMEVELRSGRWMEFLNMNPPHFHLLVLPFVWLPIDTAAYGWFVLNLWAGIMAALMVGQELRLQPRREHWLPIVAAASACAATGATAVTVQFSGLLVLLVALAWRALHRGNEGVAGVVLGVLIALKPFLGLFVPVFLLGRRLRLTAYTAGAGAASFALGVLIFGIGPHLEWVRTMGDISWVWGAMNGSVQALFSRLFEGAPYYAPLGHAGWLVRPAWLVSIAIIGWHTLRTATRSLDHAFASTVLGALLISPLGWVYYHWLALPGCLALWRRGAPRLAVAGLALMAVPLIFIVAFQPAPLATLTIGSTYTWATLLLWLAVVRTPVPVADE